MKFITRKGDDELLLWKYHSVFVWIKNEATFGSLGWLFERAMIGWCLERFYEFLFDCSKFKLLSKVQIAVKNSNCDQKLKISLKIQKALILFPSSWDKLLGIVYQSMQTIKIWFSMAPLVFKKVVKGIVHKRMFKLQFSLSKNRMKTTKNWIFEKTTIQKTDLQTMHNKKSSQNPKRLSSNPLNFLLKSSKKSSKRFFKVYL